jgi:hypothetical protein
VDRAVIQRGALTTTIVAVPERFAAVQVAAEELVDDGAQSIELCGSFGPKWVAEVVEATGGRVAVGGVSYGMESMPALASLFAPASA